MIAFLEGRVVEKAPDRVVLAVGGVGYDVLTPAQTLARLPGPGKTARLFTRLQIRDDAMLLYGFGSVDERSLFDDLVSVNGVGPKVALAVLSILTPDSLRRAVATADTASLGLVPGVGRKLAGRLVLELKDRIGLGGEAIVGGPLAEVREALLALGLSPQEARDALDSLAPDGDRPVEDLLREALRSVDR